MPETSTPLITVGLPTYGRPTLLYEAIESCLKQDCQDFELLVADSCADDSIERVVSSFNSPKIRYKRCPSGTSLPQKLNAFLKEGRGEWCVILGDDDAFEPGYLAAMVERSQKNPDTDLIRTRYSFMNHQGQFMKNAPTEPERLDPPDFLNIIFLPWYERMVNISGVFFRRKKLLELGGFIDTPYGWNADTAAWSTLGSQSPACFEAKPLVRLRLNTDAVYKAKRFDLENYLRMKRIFFDATQAVFERAADGTGITLEKIRSARRMYLRYWMREEARLTLDDEFIACLKSGKTWVRDEIGSMMRRIRESGLPLCSKLFLGYEALSYLPGVLRKSGVFVYLILLRIRRKMWPPSRWTFFGAETPHPVKRRIPFLFTLGALAACSLCQHHAGLFRLIGWSVSHLPGRLVLQHTLFLR